MPEEDTGAVGQPDGERAPAEDRCGEEQREAGTGDVHRPFQQVRAGRAAFGRVEPAAGVPPQVGGGGREPQGWFGVYQPDRDAALPAAAQRGGVVLGAGEDDGADTAEGGVEPVRVDGARGAHPVLGVLGEHRRDPAGGGAGTDHQCAARTLAHGGTAQLVDGAPAGGGEQRYEEEREPAAAHQPAQQPVPGEPGQFVEGGGHGGGAVQAGPGVEGEKDGEDDEPVQKTATEHCGQDDGENVRTEQQPGDPGPPPPPGAGGRRPAGAPTGGGRHSDGGGGGGGVG